MLNELSEMLTRQDYHRCVDLAKLLLSVGGQSAEELIRIQCILARSYSALYDFNRALDSGNMALEVAEEVGSDRLLAMALAEVGVALAGLRRFETALTQFERFWCMRDRAGEDGRVLFATANIRRKQGYLEKAIRLYLDARDWFAASSDSITAHQCRHEALLLLVELGETDQIVPLLAEGDQFVTSHPERRLEVISHALDWSRFLYASGEFQKSVQTAFQALEAADEVGQQAEAHLQLARGAQAMSQTKDALSFALAARVAAIDARRYDVEFEASDIIFRFLHRGGASVLQELQAEFREHGVDIFHYLSEDWVQRSLRSH